MSIERRSGQFLRSRGARCAWQDELPPLINVVKPKSYRERRLLFLTLMQIGTRFFVFALQLGWKRGFVVNADLRSLHKLTSTNPKGQLATHVIITRLQTTT